MEYAAVTRTSAAQARCIMPVQSGSEHGSISPTHGVWLHAYEQLLDDASAATRGDGCSGVCPDYERRRVHGEELVLD